MLYNVNEQRSSLRTREVDSSLFCNILKDKEGYRPMDEIDLKLLRLLQKNSRTPIKTLAGEVRLSSPAVSARIERLEKQGVIRAYTLDLDPLQLGHHILAYVHLDMQPAQKAEFYPFIAAIPNVLECNCVTGNYSMLIKVSFPSTQDLDGFIGKLQQFGKTETQIVFSSPVPPRAIVICPPNLFSEISVLSPPMGLSRCRDSPFLAFFAKMHGRALLAIFVALGAVWC